MVRMNDIGCEGGNRLVQRSGEWDRNGEIAAPEVLHGRDPHYARLVFRRAREFGRNHQHAMPGTTQAFCKPGDAMRHPTNVRLKVLVNTMMFIADLARPRSDHP